ncbi:MAG: hypothetical protein Q9190_003140 [Brigantiaea leucoxantha]
MLHSFSTILLLLPFLTTTPTLALTLTVSSTLPALPALSHATLTTHGLTLDTPVTRTNTFHFSNLTLPDTYNLNIWCRDWDFDSGIVIVKAPVVRKDEAPQSDIEVYRIKNPSSGKRTRVLPDAEGKIPWAMKRKREFYEERSGFNPLEFLKSPMILMAVGGLALVIGMPYLLENMDPEMRKEFEEQQKKSVLNGAAGGGNPLQNFDMAGWMAGQTSGGGGDDSGRQIEGESRGSGAQTQGKGGTRRRG